MIYHQSHCVSESKCEDMKCYASNSSSYVSSYLHTSGDEEDPSINQQIAGPATACTHCQWKPGVIIQHNPFCKSVTRTVKTKKQQKSNIVGVSGSGGINCPVNG